MLSDERDLTHIDRLRIGSLHVEPPFADEDLLHEITELESEVERLQAENLRLDDCLERADAEVMRARERLAELGVEL
jgi:predicted nuclease with TOPRIM domain